MSKGKHAGGRPTKYRPEICEGIPEFFRNGKSIEEVCRDDLHIAKDTCYAWIKKYPEFSDAIKTGLGLSEAWWQTLGRAGAAGKAPINPAVWIFNMKNRFHWADRTENKTVFAADDNVEEFSISAIIKKVNKELKEVENDKK